MTSKVRDHDKVREHGVVAGRLDADAYAENFADLHPPLTPHEALVEADRCYFCHDAPCITACPTGIDIPMFIRQISAGNTAGAARTIYDQNILGGMCARVCPTETLCEQACVRNSAEEKPVRIGLLQRFATDHQMALGRQPYRRAAPTGKTVAVVGAGPAGLACAHRLALHGHQVTLLDAKEKPGGLNEYGIAAYKTTDDFAQREVDFILGIGGVTLETGKALGRDLSLGDLSQAFDALFLGIGLAGVNQLDIEGQDLEGVASAVDYIEQLRQTSDLKTMPVGRHVVVIGGGMTAIDVAVQSKLLGAEEVTIVYRRGRERMSASVFEQDLARTRGVHIRYGAQPTRLIGRSGKLQAVEFTYTTERDGRLVPAGESFELAADMLFTAIGQRFDPAPIEDGAPTLAMEGGRIKVDDQRRTSVAGIWAGGDCVLGGEDLTVAAVEDGKIAALSIHRTLQG